MKFHTSCCDATFSIAYLKYSNFNRNFTLFTKKQQENANLKDFETLLHIWQTLVLKYQYQSPLNMYFEVIANLGYWTMPKIDVLAYN